MKYEVNKHQTPITEELKKNLPKEVYDDIIEFISNVKFIHNLIQPEEVRGFIKDKPVMTYEDDDGKIKEYEDGRRRIDIDNPHILEDMDYFRERAIFFEKNGKYTNIIPNGNPKSDYATFWREEVYKWKHGMIRPDGEWIPGELYFYWNYAPIWLVEKDEKTKGKKKGKRVRKFPKPWLGDYLFFHYVNQAKEEGKHGKLLKTRGVGFSFKAGAWSPRNMYCYPGSGNPNFHLASEKSFLLGDKGIWGKVLDTLDWIATHTPLPRMRLVDKKQAMEIQLGYEDEFGSRKGLLSSAFGISLKDNPDKARGVRGPLIHYEEDGLFPNLEKAWGVNRKAVEDGGIAFGFMLAGGTGGVEGASFEGSEKLFYSPNAYNIKGVKNVYDKNSNDQIECGFFWGAYLNRNNCYDLETGEPDVIKSLIEICIDRFKVKYSSSDSSSITQKKAEEPITPQEAIMRTEGTVFPVADLKDYFEDIYVNKEEFLSNHYVGDLIIQSNSQIKWKVNSDLSPLRRYDLAANDKTGAIEIFEMPKKNKNGIVFRERYIAGIDPVDSDTGTSLYSVFVMDLWTDRIVAEYTGRPRLIKTAYDTTRKLLEFYNAQANYESNLKGLFTYFSNRNCLYLLCDTPQILKDMELVKATNQYGNKAHPYSEKVYTPEGIKKWGDIEIGDKLFGSYGNITEVIDIPFDNETDIYELTLKDGRKVEASSNHLWTVIDWNGYKKTLSTSNILKNYYRNKGKYKEYKYYIPKNNGVDYKYKKPLINSYLLGLMLGDGCFTNSKYNNADFCSNLEDLKTYKKYLNYKIYTKDNRHHSIRYPNIGKYLKKLNLHDKKSRTKFIPDSYKYNSRDVRMNVLKGLMDTDGCVGYGGNSEYCSVSKQLTLDVVEIARSLGINCNLNINNNKFGKVYKVRFYTNIKMFNLERKYSKQKITKTRNQKTAITDIKFIGKKLSKCVTVDSKDNCYLINDFIITHNSKGTHANAAINKLGRDLQAEWMMTDAYGVSDEEEGIWNLHKIRSFGYIEEAIKWNSDGNFDRVSAMGMLMILREERKKRTMQAKENKDKKLKSLANDPFFSQNYQNKDYNPNENSYGDID